MHSIGKSHVTSFGYPDWGNKDENQSYNKHVIVYKDKDHIQAMVKKWQDLAQILEKPEYEGVLSLGDLKEIW